MTVARAATPVGIIGMGNVSGVYLKTLRAFPTLEVVVCADIDLERARAQGSRFGIPRAVPVAELLADPSPELVINLTVPAAHADIGAAVLQAGKALYNEKPLAIERAAGRALLDAAAGAGVRIGGAPDTFLGAPQQTARRVIDSGAIGELTGVAIFSTREGPERWHPNPEFFFEHGAGPLFDLGVYHLTTLVSLLGPVAAVSASARIAPTPRVIGSGPQAGISFAARTPTHVSGSLELASGLPGTIMTSWDVAGSELPWIEIYGSKGTLSLPDPAEFNGDLRLRRGGEKHWSVVPAVPAFAEAGRGLGAAEMVEAMRAGRPHRATGERAFHVLDIMCALYESSEQKRQVELQSTCERPEPLPLGWPDLGQDVVA